jgi:FixJ family two-component response regulator
MILSPPIKRGDYAMPSLIYVVDDEQMIGQTLVLILKSSGFNAVSFVNPLEALHSAETICPDILLSDVAMPQMSGVDLGRQFRAMYPSCRVLLFSGQAETSVSLSKASDGGRNFEVLAKPIHPAELITTLNAWTTPVKHEGLALPPCGQAGR